jgi:hypothetical protein
MSAQVQLQPIRRPIGNTVIIVVLAFTVGAVAAVTMQGRQLAESVETPVRWDAGMLEAMQGRQLAEATEGPLERSAVSDSPVVYDSWMGEASRSLIGEFSRGQR